LNQFHEDYQKYAEEANIVNMAKGIMDKVKLPNKFINSMYQEKPMENYKSKYDLYKYPI
jgi:hypothetical protein